MWHSKLITGIILLNVIVFTVFLTTHRYPPILMFLHIVTLTFLWGYLFSSMNTVDMIKKHWKEALLIVCLVIVAFGVRIYKVEEVSPGMYGDEVTVGGDSLDLLKLSEWIPFDGSKFHGVYSHPTPLMYMTAWSIQFFGYTPTAIRLPSIIFGALAVGALYLFLRLFLSWHFALAGGVLLLFQYTHVVLSRLAYEPPASVFFEIVALIFFTLFYQTKKQVYLIGIALSVGAGMYTYLNFRPFALLMVVLVLFFLLRKSWKKELKNSMWFVALLFVSAMPLINDFIIDTKGFFERMSEISIFSRHYSTVEFFKELAGNIYRTSAIPFIGDPNPGKNPAGVPLFDPITIVLALGGFIFLFRKNRFWFWIILLSFLPSFVSDIFSTEVIPEFHYYGLGHPNALRVSGFIVSILFAAPFGLYWLYTLWGKKKYKESLTIGVIVMLLISYWNWHLYFDQVSIYPEWFLYNYKVNNAKSIRLSSYLQQNPFKIISLDKESYAENNLHFFLSPSKTLLSFDATATQSAYQAIRTSDATVITVTDQTVPVINTLTQTNDLANIGYGTRVQLNPLRQYEYVIIQRSGPQAIPLVGQ